MEQIKFIIKINNLQNNNLNKQIFNWSTCKLENTYCRINKTLYE